MCLTPGANILASTAEIKLVFSYQCTVGAPVWSSKASVYIQIKLVLLRDLYMHLIPPLVESEAIAGLICTFHQTSTPIRV